MRLLYLRLLFIGMGVFILPSLSFADLNVADIEIIDGDSMTHEQVEERIHLLHEQGDAHLVAGHSEHAQEDGGLPQLDPSWFASQIFWLFVTFGFMLLVFSKRVLPNLSESIENRKEHIENDLDTAEKLRLEAEDAQSQYEKLMKDAYAHTADLHKKNEEELKQKTDALLADFRDMSQQKVSETEQWIVDAKKAAMTDMHQVAADVAQSVASKVSGVKTNITEIKKTVKNLDIKKEAA